MASLNMKSQRFSTLNWITNAISVNSFIWSGGSDMMVLMKKPLGYPPTNLLTLPILFLISIPNTLPNLALFPFNKIHPSILIPFCCVSVLSVYYLFRLIPSYYSFPLSYIPSIVHTKKNEVKKNKKTNKSILKIILSPKIYDTLYF